MSKTPDAVSNPTGYQQHQGAPGAPADAGVRTHLRNHAKRQFVPEEWEGDAQAAPPASILTVDLGGETIRATVRKLVDPDTVVVEITAVTFSRAHGHKKGDMVGCRRERSMFGERWIAMNERVVNEIDNRRQAEAAEAARQAQEEKANAVGSEQKSSSDQRQHQRARPRRKAAETGGSHRSRQRLATPSA